MNFDNCGFGLAQLLSHEIHSVSGTMHLLLDLGKT
jgi:hypothetical protein